MGISAYNRGSMLQARELKEQQPSDLAIFISDLNQYPKHDPCGKLPFPQAKITRSHNVWWIEPAESKGEMYGYWYKSIWNLMASWDIQIDQIIDSHTFIAIPTPI